MKRRRFLKAALGVVGAALLPVPDPKHRCSHCGAKLPGKKTGWTLEDSYGNARTRREDLCEACWIFGAS